MRVHVTPDHNLALDLVRTTEAAALASARWVGRNNKIAADQAAVDAMRLLFNTVPFDGIVVIGEGEKDEAPMLYNGEALGTGTPPKLDVAVDPIDGTRLVSRGEANAMSVVAVAQRGAMFNPGPCVYMEKIATGREGVGAIDITAPIDVNVRNLAKSRGMEPEDITVVILDRDRHKEFIEKVRSVGARVHLIMDGDVAGAITAAQHGTGVDLLYGIGGTPEGVIAAAALKCLGGEIQGRLYTRNEEERRAALDAGYDLDRVLSTDDLVHGEDVFFAATGITDGVLLKGVRYSVEGATSESIVMRSKSGTIRVMQAEHRWDKLMPISAVDYVPERSGERGSPSRPPGAPRERESRPRSLTL